MRILLADDQTTLQATMRLWLEQLDGFVLAGVVVDVPSLLQEVQALQPEIVLLDWELPGFTDDGERQRILKQLRASRLGLRIVALSAKPVSRQQALAHHVDAFVSKSEAPDYLAIVLQRLHQVIDEGK